VTAPTSAHSLVEHLELQLLPRISPFLERLKSSHRERERERHLREEQDKAFQDSARKDLERIAMKMASEKQQMEERQRQLDETRLEEIKKRRAKEDELKHLAARMDWRRWIRRSFVFPEAGHSKEILRFAVRLPDGNRVICLLSPTATLTALYAFVDMQLIPPDLRPEDDPHPSPNGIIPAESAIDCQIRNFHSGKDWWGFKLVLAYPRREIPWEVGCELSGVECLKGGGQLIVEMLGRERVDASKEDIDDAEGYSSEESN
jgi:FAS-associated factor 2